MLQNVLENIAFSIYLKLLKFKYVFYLNFFIVITIFASKNRKINKCTFRAHRMHKSKNIFLDSEQFLTYTYPPKNASKYPQKNFFGHPTDFRGLIRPLNIFLARSKRYSYHKYGIGIYIEFHCRLWGRFFW